MKEGRGIEQFRMLLSFSTSQGRFKVQRGDAAWSLSRAAADQVHRSVSQCAATLSTSNVAHVHRLD
jgi:hypothetical protein